VAISTTFLEQLFTLADSKSANKTVKFSVFFSLSGSGSTKAAIGMLMKLTLGLHVYNITCLRQKKLSVSEV